MLGVDGGRFEPIALSDTPAVDSAMSALVVLTTSPLVASVTLTVLSASDKSATSGANGAGAGFSANVSTDASGVLLPAKPEKNY